MTEPRVAIIMPVSRDKFLYDVFGSLNSLLCDTSTTSLLVYVDGDTKLFEKTREFVRLSKFTERICIYRKKGLPNVSHMASRRKRIADIHNEIKAYIKDCDYVFATEDDTVLPNDTLIKLMAVMNTHDNVGAVSGVQLGRWGFTVCGIWCVDDVNNPTKITSKMPINDIEQVDACGLYCLLTKKENYMSHNFKPFEDVMGPDVEFCLGLRKKGLTNYVDWSINTAHMTEKCPITINDIDNKPLLIQKIGDKWKTGLV